MILRILQAVDLLLLFPMFLLGVLAGLSEGGVNPTFSNSSGWLAFSPIIGIIGVIAAEILRRHEQATWALIAALIPLAVWTILLIWLQRDTGFLF